MQPAARSSQRCDDDVDEEWRRTPLEQRLDRFKAELEDASTESLASDKTMGVVLKNTTAAKAKELSASGCNIVFGSLVKGEALFVPPAWFLGTAVGGNSSVSGVRVASFMKVNRSALHNVREASEPEHAAVATVLLDTLSLKF